MTKNWPIKQPKIVTSHVYPPIPIRSHDWRANDARGLAQEVIEEFKTRFK